MIRPQTVLLTAYLVLVEATAVVIACVRPRPVAHGPAFAWRDPQQCAADDECVDVSVHQMHVAATVYTAHSVRAELQRLPEPSCVFPGHRGIARCVQQRCAFDRNARHAY